MPTFERTPRFDKDREALSEPDQQRFRQAVKRFVSDLATGEFRQGLRIKRVQGTTGIYEMSWAPDGRATWQYGHERRPGHPHVIWRRVGRHDVLARP